MKRYVFQFSIFGLAGIAVFYFASFVILIRKSFFTSVSGRWIGFGNYRSVLSNQIFWIAAKNTAIFTVGSIVILLTVSMFFAWFLLEETNINRLIKTGCLIPLAVPAGAMAFLWDLLFDAHGLLNGICSFFGITPENWMQGKTAMWILIGVYVWKNLGYYIVLWSVAILQVPRDICEAAKTDGAGDLRIFCSIVLPQMKTSSSYIILFAVMSSFQMFREAYVAAGEYPAQSIYLLQHLMNNWYRQMDEGKLAAASGIWICFLAVFTIILSRGIRKEELEQ